MRLIADHVSVSVPGSAGNLGPGFDALGMALGVRDEIEVRAVGADDVVVEVEGEGAGTVPTDGSHLFIKAFREALSRVGAPECGVHLTAKNAIPHGQGLGSSAATVVAAITAARAMIAEPEALDIDTTLTIATAFEGHPDNAAPAIHGGATVCWQDSEGAHAVPIDVSDEIETAVVIPHGVLPTATARAVLPAQVPHPDAAFNVSRAALLVHALAGDTEHLFAATEDKLHQNYRADHMASAVAMMRHLRDQGLAAVISGAGPSVLVLGTDLLSHDLGTGALPWASGIGEDDWRCVRTVGRVPGATAKVVP